jgi:hypothetical protein
MDLPIKYRGRQATSEDVAFISQLIAANPDDSRRGLSVKLCQALNWVQPNGTLRDMVSGDLCWSFTAPAISACRRKNVAHQILWLNAKSLYKSALIKAPYQLD